MFFERFRNILRYLIRFQIFSFKREHFEMSLTGSLDGQKALEGHVLHDGHHVHEAGAGEQV